jgi:hypothetical protein
VGAHEGHASSISNQSLTENYFTAANNAPRRSCDRLEHFQVGLYGQRPGKGFIKKDKSISPCADMLLQQA